MVCQKNVQIARRKKSIKNEFIFNGQLNMPLKSFNELSYYNKIAFLSGYHLFGQS